MVRRNLVARVFLTVLVSAVGVLGLAMPAHAQTWYGDGGLCGTFWADICAAQWTGSWPGGQVRAMGDRNEYEVALESSCGGGPFVIVATTFPKNGGSVYTPVVSAGKTCAYQAFVKFTSGGNWWRSNVGSTYLGD
jgi:hypothetical protein